jgi:hypothetical protein
MVNMSFRQRNSPRTAPAAFSVTLPNFATPLLVCRSFEDFASVSMNGLHHSIFLMASGGKYASRSSFRVAFGIIRTATQP